MLPSSSPSSVAVGLVPVGGAAPLRLGRGLGRGGGRLRLGGPVGLLRLLALPVVGHLVGGHRGRGRHGGGRGSPGGGRGRLVGPVGGALSAPVVLRKSRLWVIYWTVFESNTEPPGLIGHLYIISK